MILDTYKLHNGVDETEVDCKCTNQFWPSTPNSGNNGYKLSELTTKDGDKMVAMIKFLNPIFTLDQPSRVQIGMATMIIKSYLGQQSMDWENG